MYSTRQRQRSACERRRHLQFLDLPFFDDATLNKVAGHGLFNAFLAWAAPNNRYEIALWGKNLTNKAYVTAIAPVITQGQINYNEPRTYGIQLSAHF